MVSVYVELPLYTDPSYQYNASLENQSRRFRFNWNDRTASWYMSLYNDDGSVIVEGYKLVPQFPMMVDYDLSSLGLTGYFLLVQRNANQLGSKNLLITDIPERYTLFYIYEEQS